LLFCIIFLLYLILTPPAYDRTVTNVSGKSVSDHGADGKYPIKHTSKTYFIIAVFTENEFLTNFVSNQSINRNLNNCRQLLRVMYYAFAVMLTSFGVLIHYRKCYIRRADQMSSVLAIVIGGHAPPQKE
jgi:hypothetical protein